jgi:anaerobic magnesium-protoporphyrin IX monomethyl ester cyclase
LKKEFNVDEFWMTDDIFGLKPNWVQEFNDEIQRGAHKFRYKIQSRVDLLLKSNNVQALAESGMEEVWVGAESGSQSVLDAMDKGITIEQIEEATRRVKACGKKINFFLQFGYLGETHEDIEKTIRMLLDLMPDEVGISVSYPLPGTGFYEKVKKDLEKKQNWTDSDDLDMMCIKALSTATIIVSYIVLYINYTERNKAFLI